MSIPFERDPAANDLLTNERMLKIITPNLMKTIRKALGLSQEQMANLVGVSRQMINYYEQGDAYPSIGTWINWTDAVEKRIRKLSGVKVKQTTAEELFKKLDKNNAAKKSRGIKSSSESQKEARVSSDK